MPSQLHEALLQLFRNRPTLAAELLSGTLNVDLPEYTEARVDSADLGDIQPAIYRADLVVLLLNGAPVLGIVLEVQLSTDEDKRFVWPVYVTNLRARIRCPVCLLVVTAKDSVARWAGKPIELGGDNRFRPWVLGPSAIPEITDETQAEQDPELSVLSAMAHGRDADVDKSVKIASIAQAVSLKLDASRSMLYFDLVQDSLSEAAQRALHAMDPAKYEYQSAFARRYLGEGSAKIVLRLLNSRFGPLPAEVQELIRCATGSQLEVVADRCLDAKTLTEALGVLESV